MRRLSLVLAVCASRRVGVSESHGLSPCKRRMRGRLILGKLREPLPSSAKSVAPDGVPEKRGVWGRFLDAKALAIVSGTRSLASRLRPGRDFTICTSSLATMTRIQSGAPGSC